MRYLAILAVVVLAGCGMLSKDKDRYSCPKTGFLPNAERVSLPKADVVMRGLSTACDFSKRQIVVDVTVPFVAKKKDPQEKLGFVDVTYFVALLSADKIVQRQTFTTKIEFGEAEAGAATEEHTVLIPIKAPTDVYQYTVAVGFTMTPEQMQQNKGTK